MRPFPLSPRQFALLAQDHWYRSDEVWRAADCPAGPGPVARLAGETARWYRAHVPEAPGAGAAPPGSG